VSEDVELRGLIRDLKGLQLTSGRLEEIKAGIQIRIAEMQETSSRDLVERTKGLVASTSRLVCATWGLVGATLVLVAAEVILKLWFGK
jgi:hypothetical protein